MVMCLRKAHHHQQHPADAVGVLGGGCSAAGVPGGASKRLRLPCPAGRVGVRWTLARCDRTCRALAAAHHDDAPHVLHTHLWRDVHAKRPAVVPALCVDARAVLAVAVLRAGWPSMTHPAKSTSFHAGSFI